MNIQVGKFYRTAGGFLAVVIGRVSEVGGGFWEVMAFSNEYKPYGFYKWLLYDDGKVSQNDWSRFDLEEEIDRDKAIASILSVEHDPTQN